MVTVDQIKELKKYYTDDLYAKVREEQKIDQEYRDDTFKVDEIRAPHKVWRSGIGAEMVDSPAEQIITSNPQAFFEIQKGDKAAGIKLSELVNVWIGLLRKQNPQPFKESVKNKLGRGENYIQICHNEAWVLDKPQRFGLPVLFLVPDPMVIYGSPEEDNCGWEPNVGVPNRVIIAYERQPLDVILRYPSWSNPKEAGIGNKKQVTWWGYIDKDIRYFEADEEPLLKGGIQPNIYGFVPFVRKYSGFGRRSPQGKLEDLIVSDIRFARDLIKQECIKRSNIYSVEDIFAHRPRTIIAPAPGISQDDLDELNWGSYDLNQITYDPGKGKPEITTDNYPAVPPEMYASHASIRAEIAQRNPFVLAGYPFGASGRQQSMSKVAGMRRYDTIIENTELEWATAFEMALKICHPDIVPTLKPDGIRAGDLNTTYKCEVRLKAKDPIEEDNLVTLGDRLWNMGKGSIDLETFHIQFQGRTQAESKRIKAKMMAEKLTLFNPDVASVLAMVFGEETGMQRWLQEAQQRRQAFETQGKGLVEQPPPTTEERVRGEVETPLGREMGTEGTRGARTPPIRYERR